MSKGNLPIYKTPSKVHIRVPWHMPNNAETSDYTTKILSLLELCDREKRKYLHPYRVEPTCPNLWLRDHCPIDHIAITIVSYFPTNHKPVWNHVIIFNQSSSISGLVLWLTSVSFRLSLAGLVKLMYQLLYDETYLIACSTRTLNSIKSMNNG
jgi:hypothetical protein